jgi:hypothetical protein
MTAFELMHKLELNHADFFANGNYNLVYKHPTQPDYLVKVLAVIKGLGLVKSLDAELVKELPLRFANSRWLGTNRLIRKINQFRVSKALVREFIEMVRLRFHDEFLLQPPPFMQKVVGFVDTNLGFAMVVKAEKGRDGNYAPTLRSLLREKKVDAAVLEQLEKFYQQLTTYDFIISDFRPANVVYAHTEQHGDHFVLIDGIGDKTLFPILRFSYYLRNRAKQKAIQKFKQHVSNRLEKSPPKAEK